MRWLIDGYNVIRRDPDLTARDRESLAAGRAALVRLLARHHAAAHEDFVVVFDGTRTAAAAPPDRGRVEVLYSREPERADDVLIRLAGRWREAAVVVTGDRTVQTGARRAGAVVVDSDRFLDALAAGGADVTSEDDDEEEEAPRAKGGNPRRPSKDARAAARALRRLRPR